MYSLISISYADVEILALIFFDYFSCMIPYSIDMDPTMWFPILSCTACYASIQMKNSEKFIAPIMSLYSIVFFTHTKHLFRIFQKSLSILDKQVLRKDTNGSS